MCIDCGYVQDRVNRGVALLDQHRPGWAELIDFERLDIQDGYYCVLGQLYGNCLEGLYALGERDLLRNGFNASDEVDRFDVETAWREAVNARTTTTGQ